MYTCFKDYCSLLKASEHKGLSSAHMKTMLNMKQLPGNLSLSSQVEVLKYMTSKGYIRNVVKAVPGTENTWTIKVLTWKVEV